MERFNANFSTFRFKMGKKRRLNRLINKWIKSDLPEDSSTVLLLGVTRIPTSPAPARRPSSLPLSATPPGTPPSTAQARRSSFSTRRQQQQQQNRKPSGPPTSITATLQGYSAATVRAAVTSRQQQQQQQQQRNDTLARCAAASGTGGDRSTPPPPPPPPPNSATSSSHTFPTSSSASSSASNNCNEQQSSSHVGVVGPVMDRSVDSIGTCSLDVEASADLSDWSEASSGGTLRSASLKTPSTEPHLPSYLSLACTVNGYSTTTNYDPDRLARSRDASPHRLEHDNLTAPPKYSIQNNLLSPPNLVPLPTVVRKSKSKMADNAITTTHHSHSSIKTSYIKESRFTSSIRSTTSARMIGSDVVDRIEACYENGHHVKSHLVDSSTTTATTKTNGQEITKEETKSFIQQRVERLYGPGALAQGFFVSTAKKQDANNSPRPDRKEPPNNQTAGPVSLNSLFRNGDSPMKQSTSNPTLPVLRHLRPEFRAQLPIISPRKSGENNVNANNVVVTMQKSSTVPKLNKDDGTKNLNGHNKENIQAAVSEGNCTMAHLTIAEESGDKDGHYFLKILQNETNRLLKLADRVEDELQNGELNEENIGKIRSAAGKARLLVSQKMQQFKGLCTNNITQVEGEAYPTTNEDLQGFWDMVMLQVDQVDALFKEIDTLKSNNWQEEVKTVSNGKSSTSNGKPKKMVTKPVVRPASGASEELRKQREAARKKMIEERRKAMKAASNSNGDVENIEIFVPESS